MGRVLKEWCDAGMGKLQGQQGDKPRLHLRPVAAAAQSGCAEHAARDRGRLLDGRYQVRKLLLFLNLSPWGGAAASRNHAA